MLSITTRNRNHQPWPWSVDDHQSRHLRIGRAVVMWIHGEEDLRLIVSMFQESAAALRCQMTPRGTFAVWCDTEWAFKPVCQHPHHEEEWHLENASQLIIVTRVCTLCHHKKRLAKGQTYIKIKQVFINKCYIIQSVHKLSGLDILGTANDKMSESPNTSNPQRTFLEKTENPLNSRSSAFHTGLRLVPRSLPLG